MEPTEIFSLTSLPKRTLSTRRMVSLAKVTSWTVADAIEYAKRDMAMALATRILEAPDKFFWSRTHPREPAALEYGVDCVVLTVDEYLMLKRDAFAAGYKNALGVSPLLPNERP
jgi:hypothetical protein